MSTIVSLHASRVVTICSIHPLQRRCPLIRQITFPSFQAQTQTCLAWFDGIWPKEIYWPVRLARGESGRRMWASWTPFCFARCSASLLFPFSTSLTRYIASCSAITTRRIGGVVAVVGSRKERFLDSLTERGSKEDITWVSFVVLLLRHGDGGAPRRRQSNDDTRISITDNPISRDAVNTTSPLSTAFEEPVVLAALSIHCGEGSRRIRTLEAWASTPCSIWAHDTCVA